MSDDDFKVIRQLGQDGAQGVVYLVEFPNKLMAAMKQFKKTKSTAKIQAEADFQTRAAQAGIAPDMMHVDLEKRRIFMTPMRDRVVDVLSESSPLFTKDLHHIMHTLDDIGILHNDANVLNLMLNDDGRLQIVDFGLAKEINRNMLNKYNGEPNICVTLHMLRRRLRKYNIHV